MLHTVLLILEIIGITLAIILGIVLSTLGLVLFVPVRYQVDGIKDSEIGREEVSIHVSWLGRVFRVQSIYKDNKFTTSSYVLGRRLQQDKTKSRNNKIIKYVEKKAREIIKKKYTIKELYDIIKKIPEATTGLYEFLSDHTHQAALRCLKREFVVLLKHFKPKSVDMELLYGSEEPYKTGKFLAFMSVLYAWYGDSIDIRADFEQKIFKGEVHIRGCGHIYSLVVFIFKLYFDESVLKTYQDIEKIADA